MATTTTVNSIIPYKLQLEEGERLGALEDPGPLTEGMHQNPTLLYAANALLTCLRDVPGLFVDFNTFVYYDRADRNRRVSPDLYVALGVDSGAIRERHGYLIWEVGKPPDFALEIASESTAQYDCTGKRDLYASMGIGEYWRYDPTGGDFYDVPLVGESLVEGEYLPLETNTNADGEIWAHSPTLNIDIYWGDDRLAVFDRNEMKLMRDYQAVEADLEAVEADLEASEEARVYAQAALTAAELEIARLQEQLRRHQSE